MRIIHAYISKKVVRINNKTYSSLEKIPAIDDENEIVILKEVELCEKVHKHFAGDIVSRTYEKVKSAKRYITLKEWNILGDINTDSLKVNTAPNC